MRPYRENLPNRVTSPTKPSSLRLFPELIERAPEVGAAGFEGLFLIFVFREGDEVRFRTDVTVILIITTGIRRQPEEKILPDDLFQIDRALAGFKVDLGGPVGKIGIKIKILEAGPALELKGRAEPAVQDDDFFKGVKVGTIPDRAHRLNRVAGREIEDRGGELSLEVESLIGDIGDKNFHVTKELNVKDRALATATSASHAEKYPR